MSHSLSPLGDDGALTDDERVVPIRSGPSALRPRVPYDPRAQGSQGAQGSPRGAAIGAAFPDIADELTDDGLVLRYRTDLTDDGLEDDEGSFLACSFWMVSAPAETGGTARARALCERLLAASSSLGLYAEEFVPSTGRHLGNFPQSLIHPALINAVLHVIRAEQEEQEKYGDGWGGGMSRVRAAHGADKRYADQGSPR